MTETNEPAGIERLGALVLGESAGEIAFSGSEENRLLARALCSQARHEVLIHTPDLEPRIYDDGELLDALRRLALTHRQTRIRVLVRDSERAVSAGHRMLELSRRLSSSFEVRRPYPDAPAGDEAFLVVDGKGLLHRIQAERYTGVASFHDPLRARERVRQFEAIWAHSEPDPEFRHLRI